ncbi:RNA pseudouridine synthase [bacterium]|nr:RNA pseudouridine synthase [bacterium]
MLDEGRIVFLDNHLIALHKWSGELVQADATGDRCLADEVKDWLKERFNKPGEVYLGVVHRLDRPVSGVVLFARTSKAAARLSEQFRDRTTEKHYQAVTARWTGPKEGTLVHWLVKDASKNKSRAVPEGHREAKKAVLHYQVLRSGNRYSVLEITLETGRHHQIRCQLAEAGAPIRGDLKYGSPRSLTGGGIDLCAVSLGFEHPVLRERLEIRIEPDFDLRF